MRYSSACSLVGHERGPKARCRWCDKRMGGDEEALDDTMRETYINALVFYGVSAVMLSAVLAPVALVALS